MTFIALAQMVEHRPFMRRMVADSRGFNPRMRYFHILYIKYIMKSFCLVYRNIHVEDRTKWTIHDGYKTFADALHDVTTFYQFQGVIVDHAWWIYGVQEDDTMIKLDHDGSPI